MKNSLETLIFIIDGLDVGVFSSIGQAQLQLEAIDVKEGVYKVYDSEGRLLRLEVINDHVVIKYAGDEPSHARELEFALRNYLKAIGEPMGSDPSCNLKCFVEVCRKFIYTPSSPKDIIINAFRNLANKFRK